MYDNNEKECKRCHKSYYKETNFHDDLDGVLHCSVCGYEVRRYLKGTETK